MIAVLTIMSGLKVLTGLVDFDMVWIGYVWLVNCSGNCDLGGVTYRWKGEVTYSFGKVVNFVIYIEWISHSK
jgi:hypothetical protein